MHKRFQMSSMRELTFFLGLQVKQKDDGIFNCQDKYVADILKKFNFATMKTARTLMEPNKALIKDAKAEDVDVQLYRSMIGSLMYLIASRPDIMFVVCACARFQVTPKVSHLHTVKRIFRYLKGQPKLGLWYPRDSPFYLEAFSDSDYAGASLDRKSTTGGCQFLGKRLISWQCKKQTIVANSTTEAEYVAAANCCGQVLWIQNQMLDYGFNFMNTKIYIDNESTICIVKNPVFHSKTKHIEIRHHFIRDSYEKRLIQVIKIHTDHNVADLLTKAFDVSRYAYVKFQLSISLSIKTILAKLLPASTLENRDMEITATIDGKVKVVSEASIRRHLKLEDYDGISTLHTLEIFKATAHNWAWEQFSSNIATAIICLDTNRTFKSSKLIFEAMVKNLGVQYEKRFQGIYYGGHSIVSTMLVQGQILQGEGSTIPVKSQHTHISAPSTLQPLTSPPSIQTTHVAEEAATMSHDSPLLRFHSLGSDEDTKRKYKGKAIMKEAELQLEQERLGLEEALRLQEQLDEEERQRITIVHEEQATY
ncbi:hypothetical protein Tco_0833595 [Tanacetum coccineum]